MTRALALLALLAAPALADCGRIPLPPPRFDTGPLPAFTDYRVSYWDVDSVCRGFGDVDATGRLFGCVVRFPSGLILRITAADATECEIRHENGHLRGWPGDHPGGRFP